MAYWSKLLLSLLYRLVGLFIGNGNLIDLEYFIDSHKFLNFLKDANESAIFIVRKLFKITEECLGEVGGCAMFFRNEYKLIDEFLLSNID